VVKPAEGNGMLITAEGGLIDQRQECQEQDVFIRAEFFVGNDGHGAHM
jgi:hypothetical protein